MNSVLIIDDDKELCALMKKCVEQENLSAVVAYGGLEGLRLLEENKDACSLIILDVMMPDMDGFQVLQKIREKHNVPVLMLTAKSDEEDKVSGLRLGADDYLTKPFSINELMARVNSLIRRFCFWRPTKAGCLPRSRFTRRYGRRNMPLTTATSCLLSANCGRKLSQIQNSRFISRLSGVWGIGSIRRHEHGAEHLSAAGLIDCPAGDCLPFGKTSPRPGPAFPY